MDLADAVKAIESFSSTNLFHLQADVLLGVRVKYFQESFRNSIINYVVQLNQKEILPDSRNFLRHRGETLEFGPATTLNCSYEY